MSYKENFDDRSGTRNSFISSIFEYFFDDYSEFGGFSQIFTIVPTLWLLMTIIYFTTTILYNEIFGKKVKRK